MTDKAIAVVPSIEGPLEATIHLSMGISLIDPLLLIPHLQGHRDVADSLFEQEKRAVIDSQDAYDRGTEFLSACALHWNKIEELRKQAKVPVDQLGEFIQEQTTPWQRRLDGAKKSITAKMVAFNTKRRQEREAADKLVRDAQEQAALKLAQEQEAKGNTAIAGAILEAATVERPVARATPAGTNSFGRSTGSSFTWKGSAAEPMTILGGIIAGKIPISVLEFKDGELNKVAKSVGVEGTFMGIKIEKVEGLRQR